MIIVTKDEAWNESRAKIGGRRLETIQKVKVRELTWRADDWSGPV